MSRRLVPALFAAMALTSGVQAGRAVAATLAHPRLGAALVALYFSLRTAVTLAFAVFTMGRSEPVRRAREPLAFAACAIAMATVIAYSAPGTRTSVWFVLAGDAVATVSGAWLLAATVSLGRCFGVLPEARGLVTSGPHRVVRHPVYLGELGASAGLALAAPTVLNAVVLGVFIAAQAVRMRLEERALRDAFGEQYERYAARTPQIVPSLRPSARRERHVPETGHARRRTPSTSDLVSPPPARAVVPAHSQLVGR